MIGAGETKKNKTWSGKRVLILWRILIPYKKGDGKETNRRGTHPDWQDLT